VLLIKCWQVSSSGIVKLVSAVGDRGTSTMALSGGKGLGPEGAQRLAELLHVAQPLLLSSLYLRHYLCFLFQLHLCTLVLTRVQLHLSIPCVEHFASFSLVNILYCCALYWC
jgi:hypothetical protein